jgi:16S rRNA (cytosine967-C5)-methyltransferase
VSAFAHRHPDFHLVPTARLLALEAAEGNVEMLSLTPARNGTDGFFAAVLERRR